MKTYRPLLVILLAFLVVGSCNKKEEKSNTNSESKPDAQYVEQAQFADLEGDKVSITEFKGKVVMIDFWETWCKPCLASFPTLQDLMEKYPEDFIVLAVTPGFTDTKEDAQQFKASHDYDFTYLMDSNGLHQKLGVQGIPFKVFVDAGGEYIKAQMGSYGPEKDFARIKELIQKHKES